MTDHDIQTRIEAIKQECDAFQRQAEQQLAFFQGGIAALEALLKPTDEAGITQSPEGVPSNDPA